MAVLWRGLLGWRDLATYWEHEGKGGQWTGSYLNATGGNAEGGGFDSLKFLD